MSSRGSSHRIQSSNATRGREQLGPSLSHMLKPRSWNCLLQSASGSCRRLILMSRGRGGRIVAPLSQKPFCMGLPGAMKCQCNRPNRYGVLPGRWLEGGSDELAFSSWPAMAVRSKEMRRSTTFFPVWHIGQSACAKVPFALDGRPSTE
jgi:hypothetical protein